MSNNRTQVIRSLILISKKIKDFENKKIQTNDSATITKNNHVQSQDTIQT